MRAVSLMGANQQFSRLIRDVEEGEEILVTRRGRRIAKMSPYYAFKERDPQWFSAYERLMDFMDEGMDLGGLRVERDDLYGR